MDRPTPPRPAEDIDALLGSERTSGTMLSARGKALIAVIALALAAVAAALFIASGRSGEAVRYVTAPIVRGDLRVSVTATGSVQPTTKVDVSSELSGTIRKVFVDYNSQVTAGQPLAELDTDKLRAAVENSHAKLKAAEARVAVAEATVREARQAFERKEALAARQFGSVQDLDVARATLDRAVASLASARAEVGVAEADLRLNETNLAKACICSPIDGIVLKRSADPGQTVAASLQAPVLFSIAKDLTQMEVQVDVDEADVGKVKEGQSATFSVDAYPDRTFPATIRELRYAPETVQGVVTYKAVLTVDNSDLLLRPGMTATAEITVQEVNDALLAPNAALRFSPPSEDASAPKESLLRRLLPGPPRFRPASRPEKTGSARELWVLRDGEATSVPVVIGVTDGTMTQIVEGNVKPDQAVIIDTATARSGGADSVTARAHTGTPLIEFRGVSKVFGAGAAAVRALSGVDLRIDEGEFVAIMGPSGSGKSTAMNILGCLDTPTAGSYLFKGVDVGRIDRGRRALVRRRFLGFVFQGFNLLPRTSAVENVELPLIYRGTPPAARRRLAMRALERVGLTGRERHTPGELSGGQQQRVAIARAIVTEPAVLLADEPTGNLDTRMGREIMELLTSLNRDQGITVIMVTHEADMAAYAERVVRFVDGRIDADLRDGEAA